MTVLSSIIIEITLLISKKGPADRRAPCLNYIAAKIISSTADRKATARSGSRTVRYRLYTGS